MFAVKDKPQTQRSGALFQARSHRPSDDFRSTPKSKHAIWRGFYNAPKSMRAPCMATKRSPTFGNTDEFKAARWRYSLPLMSRHAAWTLHRCPAWSTLICRTVLRTTSIASDAQGARARMGAHCLWSRSSMINYSQRLPNWCAWNLNSKPYVQKKNVQHAPSVPIARQRVRASHLTPERQ